MIGIINELMSESYAHYYAKRTLANWFIEMSREAGPVKRYGPHRWTPRPGLSGVWEEYPILRRKVNGELLGITPTWRELPDLSEESLEERQLEVVCILDVAIGSQSQLEYGYEIEYKHPVPARKRRFLAQLPFPSYEINAIWILDQCRRPTGFRCCTRIEAPSIEASSIEPPSIEPPSIEPIPKTD